MGDFDLDKFEKELQDAEAWYKACLREMYLGNAVIILSKVVKAKARRDAAKEKVEEVRKAIDLVKKEQEELYALVKDSSIEEMACDMLTNAGAEGHYL